MNRIVLFLRSLGEFNRYRLDTVLMRIRNRPILMALLNIYLLSISAAVRCYSFIRQWLSGRGWLRQPMITANRETSLPANMPVPTRPLNPRVLLIVEDSIPQCLRYRVLHRVMQLQVLGWSCEWHSWKQLEMLQNRVHFFDIVVFYRVPAFEEVSRIIDYANAIKKITIFDVDDLIFDAEILAEKFPRDGSELPETERQALLDGAALYLAAMKKCRFAWASTDALKSVMQQHLAADRCYVIPNALDPGIGDLPPAAKKKSGNAALYLFYGSGTTTHDKDFSLIAPALLNILDAYPQCRLLLAGYLKLDASWQALAERIQRIPAMSYESYLQVLAEADISLAPLEPGVFADCKSEIKWIEAAARGVVSVVTPTRTFRQAIDHGVTGMLASDSQEWIDCLDNLLKHPENRQQMAATAAKQVQQKYSIDAVSEILRTSVESVLQQSVADGERLVAAKKKRLLFVNTVYPPRAIGGSTVVMQNLVREISNRYADEFEVTVFCSDLGNHAPYQVRQYAHDKVLVTTVSVPGHPEIDWLYENNEVAELFDQWLQQWQPDLVHFHSIQRLSAALLERTAERSIPYFVTLHDAWWISDYQFLSTAEGRLVQSRQNDPLALVAQSTELDRTLTRQRYLRQRLLQAERLFAVSPFQCRLYQENGFEQVEVDVNGVDIPAITSRQPMEDKLRIGFLGYKNPSKGYEWLRTAFETSSWPSLSLLVVDLWTESGPRQQFTWGATGGSVVPRYEPTKMAEFYAAVDVVIVPSLSPESFGLVTREAASCGLWVVATNAGGLADDIEDGVNGDVLPVGDSTALKRCLQRMNDDPGAYRYPVQGMQQSRPRIVTVAQQADGLVSVYRQVLKHLAGDGIDQQAH